jgi:hypothetical protein
MRSSNFFSMVVLGLALAAPLTVIAVSQTVHAQDKSAQSQDETKQIPLTDQQIDGFLGAQKDIEAITSKLPDQDSEQPDPKVMAQLDAIAKKYKFANYAEFSDVGGNISLVFAGIDPETKKYIGAAAVIKKEIAEVQADKKLSPKDKKDQLDDLNSQLQSAEPVKIPANIDIVTKYYDKLSALMSQGGD